MHTVRTMPCFPPSGSTILPGCSVCPFTVGTCGSAVVADRQQVRSKSSHLELKPSKDPGSSSTIGSAWNHFPSASLAGPSGHGASPACATLGSGQRRRGPSDGAATSAVFLDDSGVFDVPDDHQCCTAHGKRSRPACQGSRLQRRCNETEAGNMPDARHSSLSARACQQGPWNSILSVLGLPQSDNRRCYLLSSIFLAVLIIDRVSFRRVCK
jgi:hypothetical protein